MPPRILENQTIEVSRSRLGQGGEHDVYKTKDGQDVIKIRREIASQWQTMGADFLIQSEEAMDREGVPRLPSVILRNPTIVIKNDPDPKNPKKDRILQPDTAQMFPKIKEYESLTLKWPQLKDPKVQEQILELCKKAERIYKKDCFGVDPIGAASLTDGLEGIFKDILEMIYEKFPNYPSLITTLIRDLIRMYIETGIQGQMRNILIPKEDKFLEGETALPYNGTGERMQITEKGKIILADTGVHDLRPTDPINLIPSIRETGLRNVIRRSCAQKLTFPAHYIMWGSMIEFLIYANPEIANMTDLPFTNSNSFPEQIQRDIARKITKRIVEFIVPKFEKHENSRKK
ncbi:MAG: hypothetical protein PHP74_02830 [Candidatus Gracilibacteria bacterium]|nr:hypothetical protein [Candidatus Gracilibacteria bacterium]